MRVIQLGAVRALRRVFGAAGERLEVVVKEEALKRQQQAGRERGRGHTASGKLPQAIDGKTRDR